jgi:hypothetical protein
VEGLKERKMVSVGKGEIQHLGGETPGGTVQVRLDHLLAGRCSMVWFMDEEGT